MNIMVKKSTKKTLPTEKNILPTQLTTSLSTDLKINETDISKIRETCIKINMGLEDYLTAIKNALSATKTVVDKYGEEHIEDDHDKRLKAALMGLEVEGYIRSKATAAVDNSRHTHVTYAWLSNGNNNIQSRVDGNNPRVTDV